MDTGHTKTDVVEEKTEERHLRRANESRTHLLLERIRGPVFGPGAANTIVDHFPPRGEGGEHDRFPSGISERERGGGAMHGGVAGPQVCTNIGKQTCDDHDSQLLPAIEDGNNVFERGNWAAVPLRRYTEGKSETVSGEKSHPTPLNSAERADVLEKIGAGRCCPMPDLTAHLDTGYASIPRWGGDRYARYVAREGRLEGAMMERARYAEKILSGQFVSGSKMNASVKVRWWSHRTPGHYSQHSVLQEDILIGERQDIGLGGLVEEACAIPPAGGPVAAGAACYRTNRMTELRPQEAPIAMGSAPDKSNSLIDWPLYTPEVKHIVANETMELIARAPPQVRTKVANWLCNEKHYESILRGVPRARRRTFDNQMSSSHVEQMLTANIIEVADDRPNGAECRVGMVAEPAKRRFRLLFEPRDINEVTLDDMLEKLRLPSVREVQRTAAKVTVLNEEPYVIEAIDFKSFYYQFELDWKVRRFFRCRINGRVFQLKVLPMGARFSCFIAQLVSICEAWKLFAGAMIPSTIEGGFYGDSMFLHAGDARARGLVYIDNIFAFRAARCKAVDTSKCVPQIGTISCSNKADVLGMIIDLEKKEVSLRKKGEIQRLREPVTLRDIWSVFGRCMYAAEVLHKPLCGFVTPWRTLAKSCREFITGRSGIDEIFQLSMVECVQVNRFIDYVNSWTSEPAKLPVEAEPRWAFLFTDACDDGAAFARWENDSWFVEAWHEQREASINVKEARAILGGLRCVAPGGSVKIYCDSQVVVACLAKGRSLSNELDDIMCDIFKTVAIRRLKGIELMWIPTQEQAADAPSRGKPFDPEFASEVMVKHSGDPWIQVWWVNNGDA